MLSTCAEEKAREITDDVVLMQRKNAEKRRREDVGQLCGTAEKIIPAGWECVRFLL